MKKLILLLSVFILLFVSCSNNVYIDDAIDNPEKEIKKIWRVGTTYFETANDAISYIMDQSQSRSVTRDVDESRTIVLTRHVLASDNELGNDYKEYIENDDLRGSINVPSDFTGDLVIDFNEKRYDFSNECKAFFVIEGGSSVKIYNGTSVIYDKASHEPYAISIDTKTVTIDEHLLDDRRTDRKALNVSENGSVVITSSTTRENTSIKGAFNIEGALSIENGVIYIESMTASKGSTFSITGGEIHSPHAYDDVVLPAINKEEFEKNNGVHNYIHTWSTTPLKEEIVKKATCIEEGLKRITYKCTGCDATTTVEETIPISDHDHTGEWITTDSTSHWRICPVCKDVIDKADHTFTTWEQNTEDTIWYRHCEICERKESNAHKSHSIVHHPYTAETCTTDGNKEHWECTVCGECFSDEALTKEITKESTVIPHHTILEEWEYDIDNHWHVCSKDGNKVYVAAHSWGEWEEKVSGGVTHLYKECSVCGARKVANKPEYLVYNIGIGELKLEDIEATPCGDFYINNKKVESGTTITVESKNVRAEFRPYLGSNTDYKGYCFVNNKEITTGAKDNDDIYGVEVTLSGSGKQVLNIQTITGGGSLSFVCYIKVKR